MFYVFYEQYLSIVEDAILNIVYCLVAIFVISFLLLGLDVYSANMVVVTIVMIIVDIMGYMYLWDIDLNAISLVNLIMVGVLCLCVLTCLACLPDFSNIEFSPNSFSFFPHQALYLSV